MFKAVLPNITKAFEHLLFPNHCMGCNSDILSEADLLCTKCYSTLPTTHFFEISDNSVEKTFYGRMPVQFAGAAFYFTKDSLMQHLMVQLKYKGNKDVGIYLGKQLGYALLKAGKQNSFDVIVPLPLNQKKEFKRGYNQAKMIAEGIASVCHKPILNDAVKRILFTETQTHENRIGRWQNMKEVFKVEKAEGLQQKHILLVDDVVTTGATLEACGSKILEIEGTTLSIACAAFTM